MPRGQRAEAGSDPARGRFGRLFPEGDADKPTDEAIEALVRWMGADDNPSRDNSRIPAGFTYLAQFIDHDISFDPTPLARRRIDPNALENFRTPFLDLDSLYGSGPEVQPFLYDWKGSRPRGVRLLVGHNPLDGAEDLPRNHQGRALVGDARNDANVIVAQLHLLFIRFHNEVVDRLAREGRPEENLFDEAQRIVRWHFQWIVVHEFLPKLVGTEIAAEVMGHREYFTPRGDPFIPLEFSAAAFRFGHSMVRPEYGMKRLPDDGVPVYPTAILPDLAGFTWLQESVVIDWERFFDLGEPPTEPRQLQFSMRIDTAISKPLFDVADGLPELPRRNLVRGRKLRLPSGQVVARAMGQEALTDEQLQLDKLDQGVRDELRAATPLWYYVLCETPDGRHLGPVGGRIVAEVLVGLLEKDPSSYLHRQPPWRPEELGTGGEFAMADLVRIARGASLQSLAGR